MSSPPPCPGITTLCWNEDEKPYKDKMSGKTENEVDQAPTIDHQEVHVDLTRKSGGVGDACPSPRSNMVKPSHDSHVVMTVSKDDVCVVPVVAQKPDPSLKPKDYINLSCAVIFAFNFIFGLLAWRYGLKSSDAWQLGDIAQAQVHGRRARNLVIAGIIVGVCTYILAFVLFFTKGPPSYQ